MKKIFLSCIVFFSLFFLFAKEGDIHVTKTSTAIFNFDMGVMLSKEFDGENQSDYGIFTNITFTPTGFSKLYGGIKIETALANLKNGKKIEIAALLAGRLYLKKSFEIYGAIGARYYIWDIVSLKGFNHGWSILVQGGARGRIRNYLGVGVQLGLFKGFDEIHNGFDIQLYASFEP